MENYKDKYEKALERAKDIYNDDPNSSTARAVCEQIFPELKESEDERIRKNIISWLKNIEGQTIPINDYKSAIAWLEKQGEQKPTDNVELKWKKGNDGEFLYETSVVWVHNETKTLATAGFRLDSNTFYIPISELEKLPKEEAEEKPTNRIEPKFNVGDWVTNGIDLTFQVRSIEDNMYLRSDEYFIDIETADKTLRLWTIQDAKDGDVLADDYGIYIFEKFNEYDEDSFICIGAYQYSEMVYECEHMLCSTDVHPAAKEQRDLLFQKMKEAGYEWDAEKKELKKIEQKPKFYDSMDDLIADALIEEIENSDLDDSSKHNRIFWIKSHRQNPTWSEEDEYVFSKVLDWMLIVNPTSSIFEKLPKEQFIERFKSLKERYTWKPSDEQLHYLSWIANIKLGDSVVEQELSKHLNELLEDLKKLREE